MELADGINVKTGIKYRQSPCGPTNLVRFHNFSQLTHEI